MGARSPSGYLVGFYRLETPMFFVPRISDTLCSMELKGDLEVTEQSVPAPTCLSRGRPFCSGPSTIRIAVATDAGHRRPRHAVTVGSRNHSGSADPPALSSRRVVRAILARTDGRTPRQQPHVDAARAARRCNSQQPRPNGRISPYGRDHASAARRSSSEAVAFGHLVERQSEVEHLARADRAVQHQLIRWGRKLGAAGPGPPPPLHTSSVKQLLALEVDAVEDTDIADEAPWSE